MTQCTWKARKDCIYKNRSLVQASPTRIKGTMSRRSNLLAASICLISAATMMLAPAQTAWAADRTKETDTGIGGADGYHLRRGFAYFRSDSEAAATEFDQCQNLNVLQPATLVRISQTYMAVQQPEKAIKWVNLAFEKSKSSGKPLSRECAIAAYETRSHANDAAGKLDQAVADYLMCTQLKPGGDLEALKRAGDVRTRQKRYEEALKFYDKAINASANNVDPSLYLYKGICLQKMGHIDEAIRLLSKSVERCQEWIRKTPGSCSVTLTNSYVHRAECYDKTGKPALAKADRKAQEKISRGFEEDFFGKH